LEIQTLQQKREKIQEIKNKIEKIKNELKNPDSVTFDILSSRDPKASIFKTWAQHLEELHELGEYTEPLSTISSTIKKELRKMGLYSLVPYVHETLQQKYKSESMDRYGDENEQMDLRGFSSQNSSSDFLKENAEYIKLIEDTQELLDFVKEKLKTTNYMSLRDREEFEEFKILHKNAISMCYTIFNDKKKDMIQTQAVLVDAVMHATITDGAANYLLNVKEMFGFTPKQAKKILAGKVSDLHPLYEPKSKEQAMMVGFYGQRCGECGSWRVSLKIISMETTKCFCHKCKSTFDAKFDTKPYEAIKNLKPD